MSKTTINFYSPREERELKKIIANYNGRERTKAVRAWCTVNGRPFFGASNKVLRLSKSHTKKRRKRNSTVSVKDTATHSSTIFRFPIKTVSIINNELIITT